MGLNFGGASLKKILFIMSEKMPVPAVNGGAVEILVEALLKKNERDSKYYFTVYSPFNEEAKNISDTFNFTSFRYFKMHGAFNFIKKLFYKIFKKYYCFSNAQAGSYFNIIDNALKKEKTKYDVIIIENRPEFGFYLKYKNKSNLILHLHNDFLSIDYINSYKVLNSYDNVLAVSNYIKRRVLEIDNSAHVSTLYNGVQTMKLSNGFSKTKSIKEKYNISENDTIFLFTLRRLVPEKGTSEVIDAFLQANMIGVKLLVVGIIDSTYGEEIVKIASSNPNIIFTGYIPYSELPAFYEIAHIGLVPSIWEEPFGNTIIEHLSAGNPVIVSDRGAIPEIVTNDCAIIIKYDDNFVDNLSRSLLDIAFNLERRKSMSKSSAIRYREFDSEHFWINFQNKIDSIS